MKPAPKKTTLPSNFAAHRFVCGCFGISEKDLTLTLERMRKITPDAEKHFPPKLSRKMLSDAMDGKGCWQGALFTVHREALYDRIRRDGNKPLFSFTGKVADEISFSLLRLYERLLPKLDYQGVSKQETMWLLVENVFVPTAFIKLASEWRFGLGTELQGGTCWYLPSKAGGLTQKPISRVLDCWLRAAGFRTAYGVSKTLSKKRADTDKGEEQTDRRWDRWKKSVGRWLSGEGVPTVDRLHELVQAFSNQVEWLDASDSWKARFTLACAMQKACGQMDALFRAVHENSSLALADMFRRITEERIVCDDGKVLAGLHTFFAVRLFQRRLETEGKWNKIMASVPEAVSGGFGPETSDAVIAAFREQTFAQMNPGNWFLKFIQDQAIAEGRLTRTDNSVAYLVALEEYIFEIGVRELNQLLDSKRKKGQ